jgi:hypothetical protein
MEINDITKFLEAQKTNIDASLSAIKTLLNHAEQQRKEIVKLNEKIKLKEDK